MFSLNTTLTNSLLTAIVTAADAGSGPALVRIYDGMAPANADASLASNNLLATCVCSRPCGTVANKTLTFGAIASDSSVDVTGTAAFFRLMDSNLNVVGQGTITVNGGSGDMKLNSVALVAAGTVQITGATLSL